MQDVIEIIIDKDLVFQHKKDFSILLAIHDRCGAKCEWETSTYLIDNLKCLDNRSLANITGLSMNTIRKYTNGYPATYQRSGPFALLPRPTYQRLLEETRSLTAAEKNGVIRTFCYFVCMCWSFQDFSRSVENIAKELDNKVCDVSRRINWLVEHGFIYIKRHQINFAGQDKHPRVYQLYIDEVPANYIHTDWWAFQLAARETQTVDSILDNFKNSF